MRFLLEGGEERAAQVVMACKIDLEVDAEFPIRRRPLAEAIERWEPKPTSTSLYVTFTGDRDIYDALHHPSVLGGGRFGLEIENAFGAAWGDWGSVDIQARIDQVQIPEEWREKLLKIARGEQASNQGTEIGDRPMAVWRGLRFRSKSELRIAEALERRNVMFFPNCKGRGGLLPDDRWSREPDFLVCHMGWWGCIGGGRRAVPPAEPHH
jgi:hypothetical protein